MHSYPVPGTKLTLHHADLYRLDSTSDVDDLALHELAEFGGIVLIEWGDVAAGVLGDHLEIRLATDTDAEQLDAADGDPAGDAADAHPDDGNAEARQPDADFGLDAARSIELHAAGRQWAGRWDRLSADLEGYRC